MWCKLLDSTVALRISSAPTTDPKLPFGRLGRWFTREPQVLVIGKDIDRETARVYCAEQQLTTEQLSEISRDVACSASPASGEDPAPALAPREPAGEPRSSSPKRRKRRRKES